MQHWWWAARGSTVSRQIRGYKRKNKGQGREESAGKRYLYACILITMWTASLPRHE